MRKRENNIWSWHPAAQLTHLQNAMVYVAPFHETSLPQWKRVASQDRNGSSQERRASRKGGMWGCPISSSFRKKATHCKTRICTYNTKCIEGTWCSIRKWVPCRASVLSFPQHPQTRLHLHCVTACYSWRGSPLRLLLLGAMICHPLSPTQNNDQQRRYNLSMICSQSKTFPKPGALCSTRSYARKY